MPLDYLPSWALAAAFGPRPQVFRGAMVALWAAVCAALFVLRRAEPGRRGALAPWLFAALSSQWLTYWMGQMMLVENLWGYAVVLLLAALGAPLGRAPEVSRRRAVAAGAGFGLLLSASPTCAPAALLLAAAALRDPAWRARRGELAAGLAAWAAAFGAWCAAHADLGLWYRDAVAFNARVYAGFLGLDPARPLSSFAARALASDAAYFATALDWSDPERYFEGLLKLVWVFWIGRELVRGGYRRALWWAALALALKSRPERMSAAAPFHSAPFYLTTTLLLSESLADLWEAARRRGGRLRPLAAAAAAAFFLFPTLHATSWAAAALKASATPDPAFETVLAALRACSAPGDRVAAFPFRPRLYLESGRLPGVPNVFYLPWQDAWAPQREATLAALRERRPLAVLVEEKTVWGTPWSRFGAGVDAALAEGYVPVTRGTADGGGTPPTLWARKGDARAFAACAMRATAGR